MPSVGQLIARMSYAGLNNFAKTRNWTTASSDLVLAVWSRYEALIDDFDGSEAPFANSDFWDRILGDEALQIENEAKADVGQPESEVKAAEPSNRHPGSESQSSAASQLDSSMDAQTDSTDAPVVTEDTEFIEQDEDGNPQIRGSLTTDIEMQPADDDKQIDRSPASQASPIPGPSHRSPLLANNDQIGGAQFARHLDMRPLNNIYVKRFKTAAKGYEVSFRDLDAVDDLHGLVSHSVDAALHAAASNATNEAMIGLQVSAPGMNKPVIVPFRKKPEISAQNVMHLLDDVMQSNTNIAVDENLTIRATVVEPPTAGVGGHYRPTSFPVAGLDEHIEKLSGGHGASVIWMQNRDLLCVPRAICFGVARAEKDESAAKMVRYNQIRRGDRNRYTAQRRAATELAARAGIDTTKPCGPAEFAQLQEAIEPHYRLSIWDQSRALANVFSGPQPRQTTINLLINNNHCALLTSMLKLFRTSYWCHHCERPFHNAEQHLCEVICPGCRQSPPCDATETVWCNDCNRRFVSQECFDKHTQNVLARGAKRGRAKPMCEKLRLCGDCGHRKDPGHKCDETKCPICHQVIKKKQKHQCFMQPYKNKKKHGPSYIFFDLEATAELQLCVTELGEVNEHVINCAVALKVCSGCVADPEKDCPTCGEKDFKLKTYFGENALTELCRHLFCGRNKGTCIMAHNFKSYDGQFVLRYLDGLQTKAPELTIRGLEILSLKIGERVFRDTLCFLPFPLAAFPKAFGIEMCKGDFPHRFNREENYNAQLTQLPDLHYYGPERRREKDRLALEKWHREENVKMLEEGRIWDFKEELMAYCKADVFVLAQSAMKFLADMKEKTGLDCFNESMTIAGACMQHYRKNHYRPNTIALIPEGGYRRKDKQSVMAIKYLKWLARSNNLVERGQYIRHAQNEGEFHIDTKKVDGLLCSLADGTDLKHVYEVHGCAWHGCPRCFPDRDQLGPSGKPMGELYDETQLRRHTIEEAGYVVEERWEHQIRTDLQNNSEMKQFFDDTLVRPPLDPRQSFYGGRVSSLHLHYVCQENEKIHYFDVCSLYPWVNRYGIYPVGHAMVLTENFDHIDKDHRPYNGLIMAKVLPPRGLFHPVLPYRRADKKLVFALCRSCADQCKKGPCTHSDEERTLTGTWVSMEFYLALEEGYEVLEVYEVYHWAEMAKFDGSPDSALLASYVSWAIKLKVEASGWPPGIETDAQKQQFVDEYKQKENIDLDPENIKSNPSLRSLAKLMANSLWGKFGQRSDRTSVQYCTDGPAFFALVFDPTVEVRGIRICNENKVAVTFKKATDFIESAEHVNAVMASFTTAQARMKLYTYLKPLGKRALYCDTGKFLVKLFLHVNVLLSDSVIFVSKPGDWMPPVGSFLGELTDELCDYGIGSYCTELIAPGPKVYSMKIFSTQKKDFVYSLKMKGFTVDSENSKKLNFNTLKALVERFVDNGGATDEADVIKTDNYRIAKQADRSVVSFKQQKSYKVVCDKVSVLEDGSTLPFGY